MKEKRGFHLSSPQISLVTRAWLRPELGASNSIQVSHLGGKNSAGISRKLHQEQRWESKLGAETWDRGISVRRPNTHPNKRKL